MSRPVAPLAALVLNAVLAASPAVARELVRFEGGQPGTIVIRTAERRAETSGSASSSARTAA